jgi:hypothetical protein
MQSAGVHRPGLSVCLSVLAGRGAGAGPWVMGDLENGLWAGNEKVGSRC